MNILIVLGGPLNANLTCGEWLESRLLKAIQVYEQKKRCFGIDPLILVSGGRPNVNGITESDVMNLFLIDHKIPSDCIKRERTSRNTIENAYCSKEFLANYLLETQSTATTLLKITVITSDFHIPRTSLIFQKVFGNGIENGNEIEFEFIGSKTNNYPIEEESHLAECLSSLALYSRRYPTGIIERTPKIFFQIVQDGWMKGIYDWIITDRSCIDYRDDEGSSPLHYAVRSDKVDIIRVFLQAGCDLNVTNNYGETPLHIAASSLSVLSALLLVLSGGNLLARTRNEISLTPYDVIISSKEFNEKLQPKISSLLMLLKPRQNQNEQKTIYLINHSQSWGDLLKDQTFGAIDVHLSTNGITLAKEFGKLLNTKIQPELVQDKTPKCILDLINPSLIISSPLTRAIQTYEQTIFSFTKEHTMTTRTLIHPWITEKLSSTFDIGRNRDLLSQQFPVFDFSQLSDSWWYCQVSQEPSLLSFNQPLNIIPEPNFEFEKRIKDLKKLLLSQKDQSIVIFGHPKSLEELMRTFDVIVKEEYTWCNLKTQIIDVSF